MKIYIVKKNADFIEGRGLMIIDKIFLKKEDAVAYIKNNKGIMGTDQYDKPYIYQNGKDECWNGFDINEYDVIEQYFNEVSIKMTSNYFKDNSLCGTETEIWKNKFMCADSAKNHVKSIMNEWTKNSDMYSVSYSDWKNNILIATVHYKDNTYSVYSFEIF